MSDSWYALTTGINCEFIAEGGIKAKGIEAYCPVGKKVVRHARQQMVRHYPVFSRYLFIRFDPGVPEFYHSIRSVDGVVDILRNNFNPMAIPATVIEEIKDRQQKGAFDKFPEKAKKQPRWSRSFEALKKLLETDAEAVL